MPRPSLPLHSRAAILCKHFVAPLCISAPSCPGVKRAFSGKFSCDPSILPVKGGLLVARFGAYWSQSHCRKTACCSTCGFPPAVFVHQAARLTLARQNHLDQVWWQQGSPFLFIVAARLKDARPRIAVLIPTRLMKKARVGCGFKRMIRRLIIAFEGIS